MRDFKVGQKYVVCGNHSENGNVIEITEELSKEILKYKIVKAVGNKYPLDCTFNKKSVFAGYLKPFKPECIVIYRNGNETVALDKTTGKKAVAKCSPEDTYDFYTGAQIAFERLTGKAEPEKEKTPFVPHLEHENGTFYGCLGTETNIKDAIGRELKVGDVVELYGEDNDQIADSLIVDKGNVYVFVMGIACVCKKDGTINGYKIIKKRGYEDVANGEVIRCIKYFK